MSEAGKTPVRGLTAVINSELGSNTYVRLGVVASCASVLLGGILWLTNLHEKITVLENKVEATATIQKHETGTAIQLARELKESTDRRFERLEDKLDRILEKVSK